MTEADLRHPDHFSQPIKEMPSSVDAAAMSPLTPNVASLLDALLWLQSLLLWFCQSRCYSAAELQ